MWDVALEEPTVGERGFEVKVLCGREPRRGNPEQTNPNNPDAILD